MLKTLLTVFVILCCSFAGISQGYLDSLGSKADFDLLSGLPISNKYGQIDAVKVVFDLKSQKTFYLSASDYHYHHEFCASVLHNNYSLGYFNDLNYSTSPHRQYLLGNINFVKPTQTYFLELSPTDQMPLDLIFKFYKEVQNSSYLGDDLKLVLNCNRLQNASTEITTQIPVISTSEIYAGLSYQAVSKKFSEGNLRFVEDLEKELNSLQPTDIIVINETPIFLPHVAGIIVNTFQTPLSHLSILGQNRNIPIMAYTKSFTDSNLLHLAGKSISFMVASDTFKIAQIRTISTSKSKINEIKLKFNLEVDSVLRIQDLHKKSYKFAGNKAHNFSILYRLGKKNNFKTPESAFAIPFYYYHQHVQKSKTKSLINNLLFSKAHGIDNDSIKILLKEIRTEITRTPIDPNLMREVEKMILNLGDYTRFRFRSSTNAEDTKEFSGAGLYTSKTGILNNKKKPIDRAIKKVWASLWNYAAFMEREYYHINHRDVFMGILAHRSFPSEAVNGVAITKNLYRDSYLGFVVNAQIGNEQVVKPKPNVICDQFVCYPSNLNNMYDENNTIEIITISSLSNGQLIMTSSEIKNLANQLDKIKSYFYYTPFKGGDYNDFAMDIEFKIDGKSRQLYIKQARIFND